LLDGTGAMDLKRVFLVSIAVGALVALVYARNVGRGSGTEPKVKAMQGEASTVPAVGSSKPKPTIAEPVEQPATEHSVPQAPAHHSDDAAARATARKSAERLAADEPLTREELNATLKRTFESKLHDRELTPSEYDRLADAVFKVRASQRVLQGLRESEETSAVRAIYMAQVRTAFAEVQDILGIPPSELGDVLGSGDEAPN
jgi:hypothetical protein